MSWRLALSLEQLRNEINFLWPHRDKSSDGAIGDAAHAASASDHNPNAQGVVCAIDVDTDLDGTDDSSDPTMDKLVEWIRTHPHPNLKYVIYKGRMFSSYARSGYGPYEWRPYSKDPHISHPHISVGEGTDGRSAPGTYDDMTPWLTGFVQGEVDLLPNESQALGRVDTRVATLIEQGNKALETLGRIEKTLAGLPAAIAAALDK